MLAIGEIIGGVTIFIHFFLLLIIGDSQASATVDRRLPALRRCDISMDSEQDCDLVTPKLVYFFFSLNHVPGKIFSRFSLFSILSNC